MAPKLSQEEFDDAVKTNIGDFDMEPDEAVSSAVEEFKLQGYSLDGIIISSTGGNTESHPVSAATRDLGAAAAARDEAALEQCLVTLHAQFKGLNSTDLQQTLAVANKEGTTAALLSAVHVTVSGTSSTEPSPHLLEGLTAAASSSLILALRILRLLMQLPDCRAAFNSSSGPALLVKLLQECVVALSKQQQPTPEQQIYYQLAAAAAALVEAACWQDEDGKCLFIQNGFTPGALSLLQHISSSQTILHSSPPLAASAAAAAAAVAAALRAFSTADDERPPASKAFTHARQLAGKPNDALLVLLPILQQLQGMQGGLPVAPVAAVVSAVRQIAANDEICKAFAEAGGVSTLQQLMAAATEAGPPELVRAAASALRQLANSDSIKAQLAEEGVLPVLLRAVRAYGPSQAGVQEALLGLLVAMVLRMPDISTAAAEAGAVEVLAEVLAAAPAMAAAAAKAKAAAAAAAPAGSGAAAVSLKDTAAADQDIEQLASRVFGVGITSRGSSSSSAAAAAVQRQACMAVRNMVVRNPELRPGFLAAGCEGFLRSVKGLFPAACKDVGAAALRDLGLDNYLD